MLKYIIVCDGTVETTSDFNLVKYARDSTNVQVIRTEDMKFWNREKGGWDALPTSVSSEWGVK